MYNEVDEFLAHVGVKGMHWGSRKSKTGVAQEHLALRGTAKHPAKSLTDAQLKQAISRMQLEKQYKDLNPKGLTKATSSLSRANKVALAILAVGTTVNSVIAFSSTPAGQAIGSGIKNAFSKAGSV